MEYKCSSFKKEIKGRKRTIFFEVDLGWFCRSGSKKVYKTDLSELLSGKHLEALPIYDSFYANGSLCEPIDLQLALEDKHVCGLENRSQPHLEENNKNKK
jgi:hypothetical protein